MLGYGVQIKNHTTGKVYVRGLHTDYGGAMADYACCHLSRPTVAPAVRQRTSGMGVIGIVGDLRWANRDLQSFLRATAIA